MGIIGTLIAIVIVIAFVIDCYRKPSRYSDCQSPEEEDAVTKNLDGYLKSMHPELRNDYFDPARELKACARARKEYLDHALANAPDGEPLSEDDIKAIDIWKAKNLAGDERI